MSPTQLSERLNAAEALVDCHLAQGRADKTAILSGDRAISYRQLAEAVNRFGHALLELGVRMEERVAILMPDSPELVYAFFGAMKIGAVAIPMNTLLSSKEYEYLLNDSRARVLVVHADLLDRIGPIRDRLRYLDHVIVGRRQSGPGAWLRRPAWSGPRRSWSPPTPRQDDMAFWLYSSGTTGLAEGRDPPAPRHARGSRHVRPGDHRPARSRTCRSRWRSCSSPTGWATGCIFRCGPAARPCSCPIGPRPTRSSPPSTATSRRSFTACPPATRPCCTRRRRPDEQAWAACGCAYRRARRCRGTSSSSWRERFGVEILDGIGSTEILHIFISNRPGQAKPGSTGQIVPGFEAKIVDDAGLRTAFGPGGHAHDQGRQHRRRLLEQARGHQTHVLRRVDQHPRQVHGRPGRLFLVRRPRRRHDQSQRPGRLAHRGRGPAPGPPGRAGKRRDGGRRRRRPAQAGGLRGAQGRASSLRRSWPANSRTSSRRTPPRTSIPAR